MPPGFQFVPSFNTELKAPLAAIPFLTARGQRHSAFLSTNISHAPPPNNEAMKPITDICTVHAIPKANMIIPQLSDWGLRSPNTCCYHGAFPPTLRLLQAE